MGRPVDGHTTSESLKIAAVPNRGDCAGGNLESALALEMKRETVARFVGQARGELGVRCDVSACVDSGFLDRAFEKPPLEGAPGLLNQ
jgi:hypothetical protein